MVLDGSSLPVPAGASRKAGEGLCQGCSDGTKGNDFEMKEGRFRSDITKMFLKVGGALAQVAQGSQRIAQGFLSLKMKPQRVQ